MEGVEPTGDTPKRTILLVATVSSFLTPFMGSSINVALPPIGQEFSSDAISLSWVATAYLLAAAVFLVPFGRIADIHGRKRVFTTGIAVYTIASLLSALSPSIYWLIGFRVLQGCGGAMIFSTGVAIVTSVFPPGERGKAIGIIIGAVYAGLSMGPFVGGFLTHHLGWRSVFVLNLILGAIPFVLLLWKIKGEWKEAEGERFDLAGSIIYGVSLSILMYGLSQLPGIPGGGFILAGVAGLSIFIWWELRSTAPVLNINLFRKSTVFAFSNLAAFINYSATFGVTFLMSLYLQYIKGLTPQEAGVILISQPVMMALLSPMAGRLSDRIESRVVASIGMALTVCALTLLAFITSDSPLPYIIGSLALNGVGFALFSSPNTNAIMSSVEKRFYGVASATTATMRLTGQMFSMGMAMLILALIVGPVEIKPEHYNAFVTSAKTAFVTFAALCFVGVLVSLARGNVRQSGGAGAGS